MPTPTPTWSCSGSARGGSTMRIDTFDTRTGGSYRYMAQRRRQASTRFHGVFHEVRPDERIVQTFTYEGAGRGQPGDAGVRGPRDGRTRLRSPSVVDSIEARDGVLASGMEHGIREGYEGSTSCWRGRRREHADRAGGGAPQIAGELHRPGPRRRRRPGTRPAPVEGWMARDVVRHLVEWFPGVPGIGADVHAAAGPSVDDDPVAAWETTPTRCRRCSTTRRRRSQVLSNPHVGEMPLDQATRSSTRRRLHAHLGPRAGDRPGRAARRGPVRGC